MCILSLWNSIYSERLVAIFGSLRNRDDYRYSCAVDVCFVGPIMYVYYICQGISVVCIMLTHVTNVINGMEWAKSLHKYTNVCVFVFSSDAECSLFKTRSLFDIGLDELL